MQEPQDGRLAHGKGRPSATVESGPANQVSGLKLTWNRRVKSPILEPLAWSTARSVNTLSPGATRTMSLPLRAGSAASGGTPYSTMFLCQSDSGAVGCSSDSSSLKR